MIEVLLGAVTALVFGLVLARRLSPEFHRRGELPKYRFLASLEDNSSRKEEEQ